MKLNSKQRLVFAFGIIPFLFFFLFPPWNFGSVRLPYQVKWPPRMPPITGVTSYAPFSLAIDAPTLDEETLKAVNEEAAKSLRATDNSNIEAQATVIFSKLHVDWQRLALMQAVVVIVTAVLVLVLKQRRS